MKNHEKTFGWLVVNILLLVAGMIFLVVMLAASQNAWGQAPGTVRVGIATPNTEPDLAGYRFYWSQESGVFTTDRVFNLPLDQFQPGDYANEFEAGWLAAGDWYFVATAYDLSGNESDFSEEVVVNIPDYKPGSPKQIQWKMVLPDGTQIEMTVTTP